MILENGAYGKRQAKICDVLGIAYHLESFPENGAVSCERVSELLSQEAGQGFSHVSVVHCETSSGVINDIQKIGETAKKIDKGEMRVDEDETAR